MNLRRETGHPSATCMGILGNDGHLTYLFAISATRSGVLDQDVSSSLMASAANAAWLASWVVCCDCAPSKLLCNTDGMNRDWLNGLESQVHIMHRILRGTRVEGIDIPGSARWETKLDALLRQMDRTLLTSVHLATDPLWLLI